MLVVALIAIPLGLGVTTKRWLDAQRSGFERFQAWHRRHVVTPSQPQFSGVQIPSVPIPFIRSGRGCLRVLTFAWRIITVTPQIDSAGRIECVTLEAAGRTVEISDQELAADRLFDYRKVLPEAFR